jgi:hypothetical protein
MIGGVARIEIIFPGNAEGTWTFGRREIAAIQTTTIDELITHMTSVSS